MITEQQVQIVEKQNEIRATGEPNLTVRARTQIVVMGWTRYMGETFDLPQRLALGLVGIALVDQVIDPTRPLDWMQNAPGPHEPYTMVGDFATQGSREGGTANRGGEPGDQQTRQQAGAMQATDLQPQVESTLDTGTFRGAHPPRQPVPANSQPFPTRTPPSPVRAAPRS